MPEQKIDRFGNTKCHFHVLRGVNVGEDNVDRRYHLKHGFWLNGAI